jgi:uncharacterized coiled-coil protein SlyX
MTKRKKQSILAAITRHKVAIAKHRDELRDILEELEAVVESSDNGIRELECAIDTLSQQV